MQVDVLPDIFLLSLYCLSSYFPASAWGHGRVLHFSAGREHEAAFINEAAQVPTST